MKKIFYTVILLFISSYAFSQSLQWHAIQNAPVDNARHEDMYFLNSNTGWIVNISGQVYKTTNGGVKFDTVSYLSYSLRSVGFLDENTGVIGALNVPNSIFRTTNGGTNWTSIPVPNTPGICGITQIFPNTFYAVGAWSGQGRAFKSIDKGATWSNLNIDNNLITRIVDTYFSDADHGFVVGAKGNSSLTGLLPVVLYTSDGGISWQTRFIGTTYGYLCWKIDFRSDQFGYVSCENFSGPPAYLITTNGGMNWTYNTIPGASDLDVEGIGFLNQSTGWLGGWGTGSGPGPTYYTTNGGVNWSNASTYGRNMNRFQFINDTLAYSIGQTVFKYSLTTDVRQINEFIPDKFMLSQNYPNPFNPSTKIRFSVHERSDASLKVYNVSGKEIVTLTDKSYQPGEYETTFTGNDYPSGVYYAKLVSGNHSETIKMVLMK